MQTVKKEMRPILLPKLQIVLSKSWKPCSNLCSRRWLKPSLNLACNLTPLGWWQLKTLLPEGGTNFKRLFWKYSNFLSYEYLGPVFPFNDRRREKGILNKVMFYFELRNVVSISYILSIHGNGNVKKVFWRIKTL